MLFDDMLELERQRLKIQDRRTDIAQQVLEVSDKADVRQYEYHMERLRTGEKASQRGHGLAKTVFYWGGGAAFLLAALLFWALFFGDAEQSKAALTMITTIGTGLGGGGFLFLIIRALRYLLQR